MTAGRGFARFTHRNSAVNIVFKQLTDQKARCQTQIFPSRRHT